MFTGENFKQSQIVSDNQYTLSFGRSLLCCNMSSSVSVYINEGFEYFNTSIPLSLAQNESGDTNIYVRLKGYAAAAESSFDNRWFTEYLDVSSSFGAFNFDTGSLSKALTSVHGDVTFRSKGLDAYGYASLLSVSVLLNMMNVSFLSDSYFSEYVAECEGDRMFKKCIWIWIRIRRYCINN